MAAWLIDAVAAQNRQVVLNQRLHQVVGRRSGDQQRAEVGLDQQVDQGLVRLLAALADEFVQRHADQRFAAGHRGPGDRQLRQGHAERDERFAEAAADFRPVEPAPARPAGRPSQTSYGSR